MTDFRAAADLAGLRILLRWTLVPDAAGTMPSVTVRRKERDFNFPADDADYVIHDSDTFLQPEEELTAHELPRSRGTAEGLSWSARTWTIFRTEADVKVETLRHTVRTVTRPDHTVVRREVELLDAGIHADDGLQPGRTYYYQLDAASAPPSSWRASATPAGVHRYHHALYDALPAVYRRHDTAARPEDAISGFLPEANGSGGQLRRLIDVFASALGALRSSADGLTTLRDVDQTDARFLPLLAGWIGWPLTGDDVARQRQEILAAPARYRTVGTVPGVATVVEHYTGWSVRVAEPAQNISLTNTPAQRNVFEVVEHDADVWVAPDDAAGALGLVGASGREVTGTRKEPFALADGMSLSLAVDAGEPVRVPIAAAEFADVAAAEAREVATAIARAVPGVEGSVTAGKVKLRSAGEAGVAHIVVVPSPAPVVTLEGAPYGRVATAAGPDGTRWIAYATTVGARATPSLRAKARLSGKWYDAQLIGDDSEPQADPALVVRGEQLWCAWVSDPHSDRSRLRYRPGTVPGRTAATLSGDRMAPFELKPGSKLVVETSAGAQTFTVKAADFATPSAATAAEVLEHLNEQLDGITVSLNDVGELVLTTDDAGPGVTLRVDVTKSTAAWALGFGERGRSAEGAWSPVVRWHAASEVTTVPAGRHRDCTAVDEPNGDVRLCWSTHDGSGWHLVDVRWVPRVLASSAAGLIEVALDDGAAAPVAGLPADVRQAAVDAERTTWIASGAGVASRTVEGTVATFTTSSTSGGLPANDVRGIAIDPEGRLWCATPSGIGRRAPDGSWTSLTRPNEPAAGDLPANDIRAVAATFDGRVWAATSAGVAVRRDERWHVVGVAHGLPSLDARCLAPGAEGSMWVGTSAGVARIHADLSATTYDLSGAGAGADDVRGLVVDGPTLWLATAAGVVEVRGRDRVVAHPAATAPDAECTAITLAEGRIWAASPARLAIRGDDGTWSTRSELAGARALTGPWSAPAFIPESEDGEREPHLVRDGETLLLAAARRTRLPSGDTWHVTLRSRHPDVGSWSPSLDLSVADGSSNREPVLLPRADGGLRVFLRSDSGGGARIWRFVIDSGGTVSDPARLTTGSSTETNPAALEDDDATLLLFRSDRYVDLRSLVEDPGTDPLGLSRRRFAGSATVVLADEVSNVTHGRFGDLLSYTPQRPLGDAVGPHDLYTPGTIAVYVARGRSEQAIGPGEADRVRQVLAPFLPATVRVVPIASD